MDTERITRIRAMERDYEADERGELPVGLKRGVLSQDALYDLLTSVREVLGKEEQS